MQLTTAGTSARKFHTSPIGRPVLTCCSIRIACRLFVLDGEHEAHAVALALVDGVVRILGLKEDGFALLERESFAPRVERQFTFKDVEDLRPGVVVMQFTAGARRSFGNLHGEVAIAERNDIRNFQPAKMCGRRECFRVLLTPYLHGNSPLRKYAPCRG